MPTGSDKHGPVQDEKLKQETVDLERAGREPRVDEGREQEPPGEDQPDADAAPDQTYAGGSPVGMDPHDVQWRSELARNLEHRVFPAVREQLMESARDNHAPDEIVASLKSLPAGREFQNVQEVWEVLGGRTESERT